MGQRLFHKYIALRVVDISLILVRDLVNVSGGVLEVILVRAFYQPRPAR